MKMDGEFDECTYAAIIAATGAALATSVVIIKTIRAMDQISRDYERESCINSILCTTEEDCIRTGSFAESAVDIDAEDNEVNSINIGDENFEEGTIGKATSSCPPLKPQWKKSHSSAIFDNYVEKVSGQLEELTKIINNLGQNQLNVEKLYREVMKMEVEGFARSSLSIAFDHLIDNVNQAKAFIAKDDDLKNIWLVNFFQQRRNN